LLNFRYWVADQSFFLSFALGCWEGVEEEDMVRIVFKLGRGELGSGDEEGLCCVCEKWYVGVESARDKLLSLDVRCRG
jgi:hypothetical protein